MLQNSAISSTSYENGVESNSSKQYADLNPKPTSSTISISANKRQICTEEDVGYQYKIGSPKLPKLCDITNQTGFVLNSEKMASSADVDNPGQSGMSIKSSSVMVDPNQKPPRRKLYSLECIDGCVASRANKTIENNSDKLDTPVMDSVNENVNESSTTLFTTGIIDDIDRDTPALADGSDYQEQCEFFEKLMDRIHRQQQQTTSNVYNDDPRMISDVSAASTVSPSALPFSPGMTINTDSQSMDNGRSRPIMAQYQDRNYQEARYKTELCLHFRERNSCPHGNRCLFAHGLEELRPYRGRHPKHKTQNCRAFHEEGYCNYGYRCSYIHSESPRTIAYIKKLNRKAQAIKRTRIYKINKQTRKNDHQPAIFNNDDDNDDDDENYDHQNPNPNVIYRSSTSYHNNYHYNNNYNDNFEDEFQQTISLRWRNYLQERQNQPPRSHFQS